LARPVDDGFSMPPEWAPHARCWMQWPCREPLFGKHLQAARDAYAEVAQTIAEFEPVTMIASPEHMVEASLKCGPGVSTFPLPLDDSWCRDSGPTFVVNAAGEVAGIDWKWNAWGNKYPDHQRDAAVARSVLEHLSMRRYAAPLVLEGGAIHVDGEGTLLTTEECLLDPNRNPHLDKGQLEILLHEYLGVTSVIWLGKGVIDDETNGHVDNLCCFARPGEVVLTWTDNKRDPQYKVSVDAYERLMGARDAQGRRLKVHKLVQPGPLHRSKAEARDVDVEEGVQPRVAGERLAGSYVNFYIGNQAIVMPLLDPKRDKQVARQLQNIFPERRLIGVQAREILLGGGNIHCITQQIPLGKRKR